MEGLIQGLSAQPVDGVDVPQLERAQYAKINGLNVGAGPGAVAASDLAVDHGRSHGVFAAPICGVRIRLTQEREQLGGMAVVEGLQTLVVAIGFAWDKDNGTGKG
jgi:hypothetical protein